jgi:hypothetical protein
VFCLWQAILIPIRTHLKEEKTLKLQPRIEMQLGNSTLFVLLASFLSIPYWRLVYVGDVIYSSTFWWFGVRLRQCMDDLVHFQYKLLGPYNRIRDSVEILLEAIGQVYTHFLSSTVRRCRLLNTIVKSKSYPAQQFFFSLNTY